MHLEVTRYIFVVEGNPSGFLRGKHTNRTSLQDFRTLETANTVFESAKEVILAANECTALTIKTTAEVTYYCMEIILGFNNYDRVRPNNA